MFVTAATCICSAKLQKTVTVQKDHFRASLGIKVTKELKSLQADVSIYFELGIVIKNPNEC